jgi:hypothetical protein
MSPGILLIILAGLAIAIAKHFMEKRDHSESERKRNGKIR